MIIRLSLFNMDGLTPAIIVEIRYHMKWGIISIPDSLGESAALHICLSISHLSAKNIGIDKIISECKHFSKWINMIKDV